MKSFPHILLFGLLTLASSALAQQWNTLTPLPDGYSGHSLAYSSNYLYQAGGNSSQNGTTDSINVFYAQIFTNGTIGAWKSTTSLPEGVEYHAGVAANGFLYVLGGFHFTDMGVYLADMVYYARINSDGTVGSWLTTSPLPQTLYFLSASVCNNTIYVVGGENLNPDTGISTISSNVYSATIQADGSLSAWVTQPALPLVYSGGIYAQGEAANGMLYVLGGWVDDGETVANTVYHSKINLDGSLAGWNQTTPLPQPNAYFGVVEAVGRMFTMGGFNGSGGVSACYNAPVMGDGTLGAWSAGVSLPQVLGDEAVAVSGSYIFMTGGQNTGGANLSSVYSMALPTAPPAPTLTKSNLVNGTFNLRLSSSSTNTGFGLLASPDLINWTNIAWGFTGTNGLLNFTDTNASQFPKRFYRAYWPLP